MFGMGCAARFYKWRQKRDTCRVNIYIVDEIRVSGK
jgi:hypothetical protein